MRIGKVEPAALVNRRFCVFRAAMPENKEKNLRSNLNIYN
jgi:hypothetical protein